MRHFVIVGILVMIMAVLTYLGLDSAGLLPPQASEQAASIDWLWNWEVVVISFLFALIVVPLLYSLVVFRRRRGDTTDAEHIEGNTALEITWTVIPLIIVVVFAYAGAYSLADIQRVDPDAMVIKVQARQFAWTFEYPQAGVFTEELHLPVDQQILLKMESSDVIHSFWVPEFRVKQDLVPGRVTQYRITPNLAGRYQVRCAELCGTSHYEMERPVIVESQAEFDAWLGARKAEAAAATTPEARGRLLTVRYGCSGCHSLDGSPLTGPTWFGLYGSQVNLADGSSVLADDAFIAESILDPKATEVAGYSPTVMQPYALTEAEIADLIAFIKTLK
jgi:cytochrome c oxidase subunit 2